MGRSPEDPGTESFATFGGFALGPGERPVRSAGPVLFAGEAFLLFAPVVLGDVCWLSLSGWGGIRTRPTPTRIRTSLALRRVGPKERPLQGALGRVGCCGGSRIGVSLGRCGSRRRDRRISPCTLRGPWPLSLVRAICHRLSKRNSTIDKYGGGFVVKTRSKVVYFLYGAWNRPELKSVTSTRPCVESAFAQGVNLLFRADRL